jgi:adenylylsulfate kinase
MTTEERHIHPISDRTLQRADKERLLKQRGVVIWLTGLSGSGKSTIAIGLEQLLYDSGVFTEILDGDNVRNGLNKNLGFSVEDRTENIRRIAELAKLFAEAGVVTICSFVSPTEAIRRHARDIIGDTDFMEVFVHTPLAECEKRDVKGLYRKARSGEIKEFTGISSPFEEPKHPALKLTTIDRSVEETVEELYTFIKPRIALS